MVLCRCKKSDAGIVVNAVNKLLHFFGLMQIIKQIAHDGIIAFVADVAAYAEIFPRKQNRGQANEPFVLRAASRALVGNRPYRA